MNGSVVKFSGIEALGIGLTIKKDGRNIRKGLMAEVEEVMILLTGIKRYEFVNLGFNFGKENGYGNWSGVVGAMIRGEADIYGFGMPATETLLPFVKYSTAIVIESAAVLSGNSRKLSERKTLDAVNFLGERPLLLLIFSWITVSFIYYYLVNRIIKFSVRSFIHVILGFYGALFYKGFTKTPKQPMPRAILALWMILSLIVATVVCSKLSAVLAVADIPDIIDSLRKLTEYPEKLVYFIDNDLIQPFLESTNTKAVSNIRKSLVQRLRKVSMFEMLSVTTWDEVSNGVAVIITSMHDVARMAASLICLGSVKKLHIGTGDGIVFPIVILYKKNLDVDIVEKVDQGLLRFIEYGYLTRSLKIFTRRSNICLTEYVPRSLDTPLGILQIQFSLDICFYGLVASILGFVFECILHNLKKKN